MPTPRDLSPETKDALTGTPWGEVYPARPAPLPLSYDGRTVALRTLRKYLSEIVFRRPGGRDARGNRLEPIDFRIAESEILIGWPDYERELRFPSLVFLHGTATYEQIGFTTYLQEATRDRYGAGTVVAWVSEYVETFTIEMWANKKSELRSILAGMETVLSPTEQMYGLRFRMPDYFDQFVRFTPKGRQEYDEQDSARNRRRAKIDVEMTFPMVALVNYALARPVLNVVTDVDPDYGTPVTSEQLSLDYVPPKEGPCDPCG